MKIFKHRRGPGEEQIFIGAFIPSDLEQYLTLYALSKGCSKSQVIRKWLDDLRSRHEDAVVINNIAIKAAVAWKMTRTTSKVIKRDTLPKFVEQLQIELKNKGVSKIYIDRITNKFHHEKDKSSTSEEVE